MSLLWPQPLTFWIQDVITVSFYPIELCLYKHKYRNRLTAKKLVEPI